MVNCELIKKLFLFAFEEKGTEEQLLNMKSLLHMVQLLMTVLMTDNWRDNTKIHISGLWLT